MRVKDCVLAMWMAILLCFTTTTHYVSGFNLTILHTNDVHSRVEEMNKYNGRCSSSNAAEGKCYGGMERLKSKIDELRAEYPDSLLLDGGDQYQGTLFFYVYGGQILSHFMNVLGYDAMGLGNHEFDKGTSGLEPFVNNATFSILSANIDTTDTPELSAIEKSVVFNVAGRQVAVVGYTTANTPTISNPGKLEFSDEILAIQQEVDRLTALGVKMVIAVGHAGFIKDMEIAKNVRGLDVVVGGHSNTFLYTGDAPAHEDPLGLYPTVVKNKEEENVLVVQDYAYGKYLGLLHVDFDDDGFVTGWSGNPVLLDNTVPKDPEVTGMIAHYLPLLEQTMSEKIGVSLVNLQGDRSVCRVQECNMGNMMADSMVRQNLRYADSVEWNHVGIGLVNSGSIRASVPKGNIMTSDILSVAPFGNTIDIVELTGRVLWEAMEHSASGWVSSGDLNGGFLQVSGLRVVYDMRRPIGGRVVEVQALCADCAIPEFEPLNMIQSYKVLLSSYLVEGGDGYAMIRDNVRNTHTIGDLDSQLLLDYVDENSPLTNGLDGRIRFLQDLEKADYCIDGAPGVSKPSPLLLILSLACVFHSHLIPFVAYLV